MEKLVDSIKQGQRAALFPPGIANFIAVNILLIISFLTLLSPLLKVMGTEWEVSTQATAQLFSILIAIKSLQFQAPLLTVCIVLSSIAAFLA